MRLISLIVIKMEFIKHSEFITTKDEYIKKFDTISFCVPFIVC